MNARSRNGASTVQSSLCSDAWVLMKWPQPPGWSGEGKCGANTSDFAAIVFGIGEP